MAGQARGAKRARALLEMKEAHRRGISVSAFVRKAQDEGYSYRRTDMLSDWRGVNQVEAKKGLLRYVRRDYYPTENVIANVPWELSEEFMYTVRVKSRKEEGDGFEERFVNIMSDIPLRPGEVESELFRRWSAYEKYAGDIPETIVMESAYRRID